MMLSSYNSQRISSMLRYAIKQGGFILETTSHMESFNEFLMTTNQMILFNSTCMCLQTIGETLKTIDKITNKEWLSVDYPDIPWHGVFGLRNIKSLIEGRFPPN